MQKSIYDKIYDLVRQIPAGQVASYGQIARMLDRCTARMVGYAMAALPENNDVPWQRVINSQGRISPRANGSHDILQQKLLQAEGVVFDRSGKTDFFKFGWPGPADHIESSAHSNGD